MEKKNSHSISSSVQSVYIVYMFTTGPGPGEVSGILLRFYMMTWLDYNVPI